MGAAPPLIRSIDEWTGFDGSMTSPLARDVRGDSLLQREDPRKEGSYKVHMDGLRVGKQPALAQLEARRRVHVVKTMVGYELVHPASVEAESVCRNLVLSEGRLVLASLTCFGFSILYRMLPLVL